MAESRKKFWTLEQRSRASESRLAWAKNPIKSKKWLEAMKNRDRSYMQTPEYRKKLRESCKGRWIGEKNPRWNGHNEKLLIKMVLKRDNFTCQKCGLIEREILQVDHIIPVRISPEKYLDINNLQSLCPNCHARKTIQDIVLYGTKGNTGFNRRCKK